MGRPTPSGRLATARTAASMKNHWKTYKIERSNRWIGWSNTKASAIRNAKKVPSVQGYPVQVRDMRTGQIIWREEQA